MIFEIKKGLKNMSWMVSIHIIGFVCWFAGLFYLPRLFVYHAMSEKKNQSILSNQFKIMEQRLFFYIMTPAMLVTLVTGFMLMGDYLSSQPTHVIWLRIKLFLVFLLIIYHVICGYYLATFKSGDNKLSHKYYRIFNEVPTVLLILIVILAVVRPF